MPRNVRILRGYTSAAYNPTSITRPDEFFHEEPGSRPVPTPRGPLRSPSRQVREQAARVQYERIISEAYEAFIGRREATECPPPTTRGPEGGERYTHRYCRSLVIRTDISNLLVEDSWDLSPVSFRTIRLKLIDDEMELDKYNEPV